MPKGGTILTIHTMNLRCGSLLGSIANLARPKILTLKRYMHDLTPQCVVFIAKASHVERIRFRSSDDTIAQISNMASYVIRRCAGLDASGEMVVWKGISSCGDGQFG